MSPLNISRFHACVVLVLVVNVVVLFGYFHPIKSWSWVPNPRDLGADNSTLGFESLLVVAPNKVPEELRWRKDGLIKAAEHSGLKLEFPRQPEWTNEDIDRLMSKNKDLQKGYALSWLGHLHALEIAAMHTTSLIIEDDADWDIGLRSQIPTIAEAVRNLTGYKSVLLEDGTVQPGTPFGTQWDLLWLGHCGDSVTPDPSPISFIDPIVPPYFKSWEKILAPDPKHRRIVHWSAGPICTYAYAITSETATKLLEKDDHGSQPYDVWLHILCKGRKLRCVTVNPELFHHHEAKGAKYTLNNEMSDAEGSNDREFTENIWHSARCNSVSRKHSLLTCMGEKPES